MNTCRMHVALLLLAAAGCSKSDGGGTTATATAVPTEAPTIAITGTPPPAPSAVASAPASASASAVASASPPASASAPALASAKTVAAKASASSAKPEAAPPLKGAATSITGKNFTLAVASPGCRVDTPCAVTLRVTAGNEFHVNKEYPYKFTANAVPGVTFLGNGDANVFSRASGDFREEGEKTATMTVRFKPTAAGEAKVAGTYKMSVCSADQCQIESQAVQLAVPVL